MHRLKGINALRGMETQPVKHPRRDISLFISLKGINALRGMETRYWENAFQDPFLACV
jgi:hypothetical protein